MNYELLKDIASRPMPEPEKLDPKGSNACRFFCPDVVGDKKFATNYGGYPRSDIAQINAQTNQQLQASLLQQLTELPTNDTSGFTDAQLLAGLKSRYCQTPSENVSFLESKIQERIDAALLEKSEQTDAEPPAPVEPNVE